MRPTAALSRASGKPVTVASVTSGTPIEPNATGDVFASKQSAAASNGAKPTPASIAPATATGVPKPAAPSINAPKANAISSACKRGSAEMLPIESLMTSKWPVSTVSRKSKIAVKTTQPIGKRPNAAP